MRGKLLTACILTVVMVCLFNAISFADSYKVDVQLDPPEGGVVDGAGEYPEGRNAVLTVTPSDGFTFAGWYRDDGITLVSEEAELHYDLEVTRTYIAKFEKAIVVGVIAEPAVGGTATQSGNGHYVAGDDVTLTATSSEDYSFLGWFDASSPAHAVSTDSTYTFAVTRPMSFIARFAPQFRLDLYVMPEDAGSVQGAGMYAGGSIVMMEAIPNKDYRFLGWVQPAEPDVIVSKEEKYTLNLDTDLTLTAKFGRSHQYIGRWVAIIAVIVAGGAVGLIILFRRMRMIKRSDVRSGRGTQDTLYMRNKRDKKSKICSIKRGWRCVAPASFQLYQYTVVRFSLPLPFGGRTRLPS